MAHQERGKVTSWYTESTYNADEIYENSPFATDPRTFPKRASTATSLSYSDPFAMIPLPSQHQLHTIEEMRNENAEPSLPAARRWAESLTVKNGDLVEKSLKSISLIRSRLLQQQEANRKRNCEFQQIRASLDIIHSLVHFVYDEPSNKRLIEFSTDDFKITPHARKLKLSKVEKDSTVTDAVNAIEKLEPITPVLGSFGFSNAHNIPFNMDTAPRPFKAMSPTSNVPTTPTKATRPRNPEMRNLYKN